MIGVDTETTGVDKWHGARPFMVSIATEDGSIVSWEADVDPLTREVHWSESDIDEICDWLNPYNGMQGDEPGIIFQNAKFDISMLSALRPELGEWWDWEYTHEILYSSHLLASNKPKDLTSAALIWLGIDIKPYEKAMEVAVKEARRKVSTAPFKANYGEWMIAKEGLACMPSAKETTWKFDMWLPRAYARVMERPADDPWHTLTEEYNHVDSGVLIPLYRLHQKILKERDLLEIYVERLKMLPIVFEMEQRGLTCSTERMNELYLEYSEKSEASGKICREIAAELGYELELPKSGMNNSLRGLIFDTMKLTTPFKTDKGAESLNKDAMDWLIADIETQPEKYSSQARRFIPELKDKRSRDTAIGYMESYQNFTIPVEDGFGLLHPSLNPVGTSTLRWSSQGPNEQQISKKENFNLRYGFGPLPGYEWWSIDYENLELRIPAYESGEEAMIEIFERPNDPPFFGSYHLLNASIVYPDLFWPLAEQEGEFKKKYKATWYQWIKNAGFALIYGCQEPKFDLTCKKPGAYRLLREKLPKLFQLNDKWITYANKNGYIETAVDREIYNGSSKRRRGYPLHCSRSEWGTISPTTPLNYHVQGTACWIMMRAMFKVQEYLQNLPYQVRGQIVAQIHDELVLSFPYVEDKGNRLYVDEVSRLMSSIGDAVGVKLTCGVSYHPVCWSEEE